MDERFCPRCGQPADRCDDGSSCGRPAEPLRFCDRCGRRLREIVIFPGTTAPSCPVDGQPRSSYS
ncbi:MAG TPA: hypothetical protein VM345_10520 [Acidimicrobiales bacterium]|nr:hypothetical protein [Acidimicrobiales bacterium]